MNLAGALKTARASSGFVEACLTENKVQVNVVQWITVVKFRVDNGGGDGIGCFEIKIGADTAKFTNVRIAGFGYVQIFDQRK